MSTEPGGEAAVVETTTQAAPEAAVSSQETELNFEAEARKMGWVPEDEFKGDKKPAKFLSAEEYYRRGEEVIPIIRARNKDLEKKVDDLEATNKRMSAMFEKTIERERAKAAAEIATLKAAKKEAIKAGDADEVERIEGAIENITETVKEDAKPEVAGNPVAGTPAHTLLIKDFAAANPWFVEEPEMAKYAEEVSQRNAELNENISFADNMKFVVATVHKKFQNYFKDSTTAANGHAAVDTGGSFNGGPVPNDTYGLNKMEIEQADKDIKAKLYPNRKAWAAAYRS